MIPPKDTSKETLCFVNIVFPITDDQQIVMVKRSIAAALSELPKVKTEFRIAEIRNGGPDG